MKILSLIIVICCLYFHYCAKVGSCGDYYDYNDAGLPVEFTPKSADDCKNRKVSDDGKCCYEYGSKQEDKGRCTPLDKYEYANIGKLIKISELRAEIYEDNAEQKKVYDEYGDPHIDCFSKYIKISLISILLILF